VGKKKRSRSKQFSLLCVICMKRRTKKKKEKKQKNEDLIDFNFRNLFGQSNIQITFYNLP